MFESKNKKFRKYFKIKNKKNNNKQYDKLYYGNYGLKAIDNCYLEINQINAAIKTIKRIVKKKNTLHISIFPDVTLTRKPKDVRMGRGKGNPAFKIYPLKAGKILFELKNVPEHICLRALKYCSFRLPINTIIVKKYDKCTNNFKSCW